jgi:hypothetical protein
MRLPAKFTEDGQKICSKCGKVESSIVVFRKRRNQCIGCINIVRMAGHKRKIRIEQAILEEQGMPVLDRFKTEYKKQWYQDNKDRISEDSKKKYLNNRENRLAKASYWYYDAKNIAASLLRNVKRRAKTAKLECDLNKTFIEDLFQNQNNKCDLTKIDFILDKSDTSRRPFAPSVDRINSKLGYTKDNVRLVCTVVNFALNEFGDQVFDKMCRAYVENTLCRQQ